MAPVYDTDIAEKRWEDSRWDQYELWERVEQKLRRKKQAWVAGTAVLFLVLSSIPIVLERWPKWVGLTAARRLAQEINRVKRDAIVDRAAYRVRFLEPGSTRFVVERLKSCSDAQGETLREGALLPGGSDYTWVGEEEGARLGLPGLVHAFCFDYLAGSDLTLKGRAAAGFAVASVKDLAESKTERMAILLATGASAEISFE